MNVDITENLDMEEYQDFLKNIKSGTFYHSRNYINFLQDTLELNPNFITARLNGKIVGILPFFAKKSQYGLVVNSLPFFGSFGGIVSENQCEREILSCLNDFNKENDVLSSVIITNPFVANYDIYDKFFNYNIREKRRIQCIKLQNKSSDDLWINFEKRVRNAIRKCSKQNIQIKISDPNKDLIDNFYKLHKEEMLKKGGLVKPPNLFSKILSNFKNNVDYNIFEARQIDENKSIAFILVFYYSKFSEYFMTAYDTDYKNSQSTSALIWESIKQSLDKNIQYYNFGGTCYDQNELYLFKRGWNAEEFNYNYYIYGDFDRIKNIELDTLKDQFKNFYVYPYKKLNSC